jgi:hypothetical protein
MQKRSFSLNLQTDNEPRPAPEFHVMAPDEMRVYGKGTVKLTVVSGSTGESRVADIILSANI